MPCAHRTARRRGHDRRSQQNELRRIPSPIARADRFGRGCLCAPPYAELRALPRACWPTWKPSPRRRASCFPAWNRPTRCGSTSSRPSSEEERRHREPAMGSDASEAPAPRLRAVHRSSARPGPEPVAVDGFAGRSRPHLPAISADRPDESAREPAGQGCSKPAGARGDCSPRLSGRVDHSDGARNGSWNLAIDGQRSKSNARKRWRARKVQNLQLFSF